MKRAMTITYEVDSSLYINVTNRCSNRCDFCIRNNDDGAYGSDSLWLLHEPSVEQIITDLDKRNMTKYPEVVFCGYGEPTYRLDVIVEVAKYIKSNYPNIKTRVNTNGHSSLIHNRDTTKDYYGAFDIVSISLNTPSADRYVEMCHPVYGKDGFYAMLDFAKNVKNYVQNVVLSVVRESLTEDEVAACRRIADDIGVTLKIRTYIGPEK